MKQGERCRFKLRCTLVGWWVLFFGRWVLGIMEIGLSTSGSNSQELKKSGFSCRNATITASHGSRHTMETRLQLDAATPTTIDVVCVKDMVLKSAPCSRSRSRYR